MKKIFFSILISSFILSCSTTIQPVSINKTESTVKSSLPIKVVSIDISLDKLSLKVGDSASLNGSVKYSDNNSDKEIKWESSDNSVISIDSEGNIKALKEGKSIIKAVSAKDSSISLNVNIYVFAPDNFLNKIIFPENVYIEEGSNLQISTNSNVPPYMIWKSANENVAKVDSGGFIYASSRGDVTISVSSEYDSTLNQNINVHVLPEKTDTLIPVAHNCGTADMCERATFSGKVFDHEQKLFNGATVRAWSVDPNVKWVGETQLTNNGTFIFRLAPIGVTINISVSKEGYKTVKRGLIAKSNLMGLSFVNLINFGGIEMPNDYQFSLKKIS